MSWIPVYRKGSGGKRQRLGMHHVRTGWPRSVSRWSGSTGPISPVPGAPHWPPAVTRRPNEARAVELILSVFRGAGFDDADAVRCYHSFIDLALGHSRRSTWRPSR
ncbi:hypothetical protein GCM10018954_043870 [Kutzneria kofuensis]